MRRARTWLCSFSAVLLACSTQAFAARSDAPPAVQDLAYGEVLFHYFQDDYFGAITRTLVAEAQQRFSRHADEAELLKGGMYLAYGQHGDAERIFTRLLEERDDDELAERAWFYLAKLWYQRGYHEQAAERLASVGEALPEELAAERNILLAKSLIRAGRNDEAAQLLGDWKPDREWGAYARYNLGVALARQGDLDGAARYLGQLATLPRRGRVFWRPWVRRRTPAEPFERYALRDKSNLALGYVYLQAGQPGAALPYLDRVRLDGPFANQALLGAGWAAAETGRYDVALAAWEALRGRDALDAAVQEAWFAVPYALGEMGAHAAAASQFESAIDFMAREMADLDGAIATLESDGLAAWLLDGVDAGTMGWFWHLQSPPDAALSRYAYHLMADHRFQEGLKQYRDLQFMGANLDRWIASVASFDDMLAARSARYDERLPLIREVLSEGRVASLRARRDALAARVAAIAGSNDTVGLATEEELEHLGRLERAAGVLERLPRDPKNDRRREQHRLLRGVLLWQLSADFPARLWEQRKALAAVDGLLAEAGGRQASLAAEALDTPERFAVFAARVAGVKLRLRELRTRVDLAMADADGYLVALAVDELRGRQQRLADYTNQAHFALAAIYDRASSTAGGAP